jgi:large subunit ribosomal protein L23
VLEVKIIKVQPKPKRRGLYRGTRSGYKKAIVKLAPGNSIQLFEGVA